MNTILRTALTVTLACLLPATLFATTVVSDQPLPLAGPRPSADTVQAWQARKFGLFIHFGLYSVLGGVWDGKRITKGYSEQIQSFAPVPIKQYEALAKHFDPTKFDPDAIVALAKAAGMKFIVLTAKHHDGFAMFHTAQNHYNVVDGTPYGRDVVKMMAQACARAHMPFGVYYSTIDWHWMHGQYLPDNDNPITPAQADFNVAQIRELMSHYGPISEVWFDMGKPTPIQSARSWRGGGVDKTMPITGAARLAGIMGWPIAHSRSPALHGFWLAAHGIDGAYVPLAVHPDRLEQALRALPALGFRGCNITIPHKQAALKVMDRVDPFARRIGAMNTVIVAADGSLEGSNTDVFGFRENLREQAPDWQAGSGPAVVLGAGGSARAVIAGLSALGARQIRLVNRTPDRAQILARDLAVPETEITVHPWKARGAVLEGAAILVNTTSLGMDKEPPLDIDLAALPLTAVVVDIVYVPLETGLLAAARRRGHPVVDGLGMLLHQGRPGFAAWFGAAPQVTRELRRAMLATFTGAH